ncbi:hypothetical protein B0T14DRAFT_415664 [Immersiella caudata]|uniref:RBR-type E3 ubiquitin transferase n=1 Tax=Immersiella caudata TaxID=314043 RepID=A0AA40CD56_9PEZI|nr:hypothetical protein B0T14DRAFT_415664 [Immersiella caudata]
MRRQRSPERPSKGSRLQSHNPFSNLFGAGTAAATASNRKRRPSRDQGRDRPRPRDRGRDPAPDRDEGRGRDLRRSSRNRDPDKGRDRHRDRKHHHGKRDGDDGHVDSGGTKHRRHHHHQNREHRQHSREPLFIEIELKSLDDRWFTFTVKVKPDLPVSRLDNVIRRRFQAKGKNIAPNAQFSYYAEGKLVDSHSVLSKDTPVIWYRLGRGSIETESWKFTHWQDETNGRLDSALSDELIKAIDEGATIGQLRRNIANFMSVDDPYRIILSARGGMRPGLLQGECWEARQIKTQWFCRWVAVDVNPPGCYVVLRGLGREYIYHPPESIFVQGMELRAMQSYIRHRLFRAVRVHGKSNVHLDFSSVVLKHNDSCPGSFTPIKWGATYTFDIPQDAAETFANEETWLLKPSESCAVCMEDKKITEMPIRITTGCNHKAALCKECLAQWLQSGLERTSWDRVKCPDCPEFLRHADMKRYANPATFERWDALATRGALEAIPNFRWCLSSPCTSGQIDDENCAKFKCKACSARHCIRHNVPWHKGETCDDYDRRNKQRKKDDKASEQMIKKTSKKCPECKKDVHKFTGCNHITCVCGHEWCYICFAPFQRNEHGFLFCRHKTECTERDPFIDLIDPAHAQGGGGNVRMPPLGGPGFRRPPPFIPGFVPPHLRRQNANANGAGGLANGPNARPRPPPGFPFREPFGLNRNGFNRPQAPGAAGPRRAGLGVGLPNQGDAEDIPNFAALRINVDGDVRIQQ